MPCQVATVASLGAVAVSFTHVVKAQRGLSFAELRRTSVFICRVEMFNKGSEKRVGKLEARELVQERSHP